MKIYVSMNPMPWEKFSMQIQNPADPKEPLTVQARSSATRAGFLPIFWTQEEAERTFPGVTWQAAEVSDDWHPMLNQLKAHSVAVAEPEAGIVLDAASMEDITA